MGNAVMRTDTSIIGWRSTPPRARASCTSASSRCPCSTAPSPSPSGIQSRSGILYDWQENAGTFEVMNPGKITGMLRMEVHAALISSESHVDPAAVGQPL